MSKSVTTSLSEMAASGEAVARETWYGGEGTIHLGAQLVFFSKHRRNRTVSYALESRRMPACKSETATAKTDEALSIRDTRDAAGATEVSFDLCTRVHFVQCTCHACQHPRVRATGLLYGSHDVWS